MRQSHIDLSDECERGRRFAQTAFALLALAALGFGLTVHFAPMPIEIDPEARRVIAWSFIGLATADALLLSTWQRIIKWLTAA